MNFTFRRAGLFAISFLVIATSLSAATFTLGDVFASKQGSVREYSNTGVFRQSLSSGIGAGDFTTGSAFDASGKLYVTDFGSSQVVTFANNAANTQGTFGGGYSTPEDIRIDSGGNVFVGNLNGPGLRKFNSAGVLQTSFAVGQRIDWFDLNSSQTTMYYTDEGGSIHRWNLTTNTALANLCNSCGDFALRLLGDGTLLVADDTVVNRVNIATGLVTQTYDVVGVDRFFALNLDPDGTTFWTGSFQNDNVYRFNIATGALVNSFNTGSAGSSLYGLSVFGEITQVGGVPEPASIALFGTVLALVGTGIRRKFRHS